MLKLTINFDRCDEIDIAILKLNEEFMSFPDSSGITFDGKFYGVKKISDDATSLTIDGTIRQITKGLYQEVKDYAYNNSGFAGV